MAPSSWCWVFHFLLWPVLMLGKLSGGARARGVGGYPGRRDSWVLSGFGPCVDSPSCCPSCGAVVSGLQACELLQQPSCHMWTLAELF